MTGPGLNADVEHYLQTAAMNVAPPGVGSDPLVEGLSPAEQLLRVLGLAANADDPLDAAESIGEHELRDAETTSAAATFAAQDGGAATALQQIPQLVSGAVGAIAGAISGGIAPLAALAQLPAQLAQGAQQALQTGIGLVESPGVDGWDTAAGQYDDTDPGPDEFGEIPSGGGGLNGAGPLGTAPAAMLGPPPVPSAGTAPASAANAPGTAARAVPAAAAVPAGFSGMPLIPPMLGGAAGADREANPDTRRVAVPAVRNGAPVQGRLDAPPAGPVDGKADGRPVAARRITASAEPPG